MFRLIVSLAMLALLVLPAEAGPRARCDEDDNQTGLHIEFGVSIGKRSYDTEKDIAELKMRQLGLDPKQVSITSDGCIEVLVHEPDGTWNTQYYDQDTLELVQE